MMCLTLILVCSMSISAFAVDRVGRADKGTTQSVQMTDNQKGEAAATRQKSSEAQTKTKQENTKKSDSESKTKDSSEEQKKDSKDTDNKGTKENSTEKDAKEDSEKNTSKEEKSTKEEKNTEKKSEETTDASEATTKAAEEKTTEAAEKKTEATTEKTTEGKDSKEATSEEKAAEETQAGSDTKAVNDTTAYTLYCYTLIPGKTTGSTGSPDAIWNGMGTGKISGLGDPENYTNQTIVDNGYGSSGATITYPTSYPDITADGTTYEYAAPGSENADKVGYYTITWFRVIRSDGANAGNNGYNTPTVDSGTATYHLDGYITLNETNILTVGFKLKDAGSNSFEWVDPEKYTQRVNEGTLGSNLKIPTKEESTKYPNIKEKNGIKYRFDGWYLDENCTNKVTFDTYSINNNVTFYGKYVPLTTNITVTKKVTGSMGDKQKAFTFKCTYSSCDDNGNEKQNQKASFNLKDGETSEIKNVYIGSQFTVEETNAEGYTTLGSYKADISVEHGADKESSTKKAEVKIEEDGKNITITNNKEAIPDTGITLDSLPFITLLALSIAGGIFYLLCRYKKRFV